LKTGTHHSCASFSGRPQLQPPLLADHNEGESRVQLSTPATGRLTQSSPQVFVLRWWSRCRWRPWEKSSEFWFLGGFIGGFIWQGVRRTGYIHAVAVTVTAQEVVSNRRPKVPTKYPNLVSGDSSGSLETALLPFEPLRTGVRLASPKMSICSEYVERRCVQSCMPGNTITPTREAKVD
jgi:hypothetical protein